MRHCHLCFAALLAASASGCAGGRYVVVRSRLVETTTANDREITASPKYQEELAAGHVKVVAVRQPESCRGATSSARTGEARSAETVMKTDCGVEMAEFEKALTRQGFAVISSKELDRLSPPGKVDGKTPVQAAADLGAQVLFQINSLETVSTVPGVAAAWQHVACDADAFGRESAAADLSDPMGHRLMDVVTQQERGVAQRPRLGAALDVNAIWVHSGQSIWFYRWTRPQIVANDSAVEVFAKFQRGFWQPLPSPRGGQSQVGPMMPADQMQTMQLGAAAANARSAEYYQLLRAVLEDFATQFKSGSPGANAAPPPPPGSAPVALLPPCGAGG